MPLLFAKSVERSDCDPAHHSQEQWPVKCVRVALQENLFPALGTNPRPSQLPSPHANPGPRAAAGHVSEPLAGPFEARRASPWRRRGVHGRFPHVWIWKTAALHGAPFRAWGAWLFPIIPIFGADAIPHIRPPCPDVYAGSSRPTGHGHRPLAHRRRRHWPWRTAGIQISSTIHTLSRAGTLQTSHHFLVAVSGSADANIVWLSVRPWGAPRRPRTWGTGSPGPGGPQSIGWANWRRWLWVRHVCGPSSRAKGRTITPPHRSRFALRSDALLGVR